MAAAPPSFDLLEFVVEQLELALALGDELDWSLRVDESLSAQATSMMPTSARTTTL